MSANNPEANVHAPSPPKSATRGKSDPAWGHCTEQVTVVNNKNVKVITCLHCAKSFQGGGVHRFKKHLAGVKGDVAQCKKVPADVRFRMQQNINEFANKKRRLDEAVETHSDEDNAPVDLTNENEEIANLSTPSSSTGRQNSFSGSQLDASMKRLLAAKNKANFYGVFW